MSRILPLALFAVATAFIVPASTVSAQDSDSCQRIPKCHGIEIELVGVDIPLTAPGQIDATCQEATSKKNEIAIQVQCNCDIPFLNRLPLFNHVFRSAPKDECEVFVFDENNGTSCSTSKDNCKCCKQCDRTCCGAEQEEIEVEVTCNGESPFSSNFTYIDRLFKNIGGDVGVPFTPTQECQKGACRVANTKATCPASNCGNLACESSACRSDAHFQLVSHQEAANEESGSTRDKMMHEVMALRVENARLEAKVEAMEHQMGLMEELFSIRAENAALKARLKLMESR